MKTEAKTMVEQFVDLVRCGAWRKPEIISTSDIHNLFLLVEAAGFNPKMIVEGKVTSGYIEQDDPNREWHEYTINSLCPFKVVRQDDSDDRFATGWLDAIFSLAGASGSFMYNRKEAIKMIEEKIKQSTPLRPILLTQDGDVLQDFPNREQSRVGSEYFVDHIHDDHKLKSQTGIHAFCGGKVYIRRVTADHRALYCEECHLRVTFPLGVKTYGELRDVMVQKFSRFSH